MTAAGLNQVVWFRSPVGLPSTPHCLLSAWKSHPLALLDSLVLTPHCLNSCFTSGLLPTPRANVTVLTSVGSHTGDSRAAYACCLCDFSFSRLLSAGQQWPIDTFVIFAPIDPFRLSILLYFCDIPPWEVFLPLILFLWLTDWFLAGFLTMPRRWCLPWTPSWALFSRQLSPF